MKLCSGCGVLKPIIAYKAKARTRDGLSARCAACVFQTRAKYRAANSERIAARKAADYLKNRDAERAKRKVNRESKPEAAAARFARWKAKNPERYAAYQLEYRRANVNRKTDYQKAVQPSRTAYESARRARKQQATPAWANLDVIRQIYSMAAATKTAEGRTYHVDHIVPLRHKLVCGLHVEFNLQILAPVENVSKGNRTWPGMW